MQSDGARRRDLRHHLARANGILLHYVTAGEGDPVVLLHGFGQTWYQWGRYVIPTLAKRYFVVAPDLRGAGDSEKPEFGYEKRTMAEDVYQLVQQLGLNNIRLIGHDFGAAVAYAYAAAHRDAVRQLVIMEMEMPGFGYEEAMVHPFPEDGLGRKVWHLAFHDAPYGIPEWLISGRERQYLRWFFNNMAYDTSAISNSDLDEYERCYASPGGLQSLKYYRTHFIDAEHNRESAKVPLEMPVLAVGGSAFLNTIVQEGMEQLARNVRGVVVPDCGHWLTDEQPEHVTNLLVQFLSEGEAAATGVDGGRLV